MAALAQASQIKGDEFMKQGNAKLNKANSFICIDRNGKKEEAAELFNQAGIQYKICKMYEKSGNAYAKCAEIHISIDNVLEARIAWRDAGKSLRHIDYKRAIESYSNAIQMDLNSNRIRQAAKLQEEIGNILIEDECIDDAILSFEKASEYYEMEHDQSGKGKMLLIVAKLSAKQNNWIKSAKIFENISKLWIDDKLLRWRVKDLLFKAALLRICSICDVDDDDDVCINIILLHIFGCNVWIMCLFNSHIIIHRH